MSWLVKFTMGGLEILSSLFVVAIGLAVLAIVVLFILDKTQKQDAVRHNFPVIGRFRSLFIHLGEFFRQYFFAMDREEMPFNRAEREWIKEAAQGKGGSEPFGSTKSTTTPGTTIFVPASFPKLDEETCACPPVIFGPATAHPFAAQSLINISAMSYGALSKPAIQALSRGAAAANCWLNTGEGGLSPWHLEGGCDLIFQLGTAKYGARDKSGRFSADVFKQNAGQPQVKMIELKLAQGAKPGKGGILPGVKVSQEIAMIRGIEPGQDSISPNRHREIESFGEMLDFVSKLRQLSGKPVGLKTVFGDRSWLDGLCTEIKRRGDEAAPDFITLDGGDGGTGAAPLALMDNVGLTLKESLPMLVDGLHEHGLRDRIKVICAGKLITPADVAWAYCVGADAVNTARGFLFSIGCIQSMRCHTNQCPTGVTTHDKNLQSGLDPEIKAGNVAHFVSRMKRDVNVIAHSCGVPHARALQRKHVRIVQPDGHSIGLDKINPYPE